MPTKFPFSTYQKLIEKQETKKTTNPGEYWIWPVSNAITHFNEGPIKKEHSYSKVLRVSPLGKKGTGNLGRARHKSRPPPGL